MSDDKEARIRPFEFRSLEQGRFDDAKSSFAALADVFLRDIRRAIPFLVRQRACAVKSLVQAPGEDTLPPPAEGPSFLVRLTSDTELWAALHFDVTAIAALLDGLFGGATQAAAEDDQGAPAKQRERPAAGEAL